MRGLRTNPPSPQKAEKKVGKRVFRVGDKVMQTRNDYAADEKHPTRYSTATWDG
jgi:exodeoxyribonuclease V alpha subunit